MKQCLTLAMDFNIMTSAVVPHCIQLVPQFIFVTPAPLTAPVCHHVALNMAS